MKRKIISFLLGGFIAVSLASCSSVKNIVKISDEVEYTKIENSITEVYERVSKGCVGIAVSNSTQSGSGSGVIYKYDDSSKTYYVVTNHHVIDEMTNYSIYFGDAKYTSASVLGYDETNDIAVLTFQLDLLNSGIKDSLYVNDIFGYDDTDLVSVGQTVLTIGCPLGLSNYNILTTGVVSSVETMKISTDSAINPGNSGGGAFNLEGRLIGIVEEKEVWKYSTTQGNYITSSDTPIEGRGYCISLDIVKNCIKNIESKKGAVERPTFGMTVTTINTILDPDTPYKDYLPDDGRNVYFVVTGFDKSSNANNCHVKTNDVLLEINGNTINSSDDIKKCLNTITKNDSVKLKVYRINLGKKETIELTITFK